MRTNRKSKFSIVLSILFSILIIVYVVCQLDWTQVRLMIVGLKWGWVILAFTVHVINYILRTFRLQIILPLKKVPYYQLFGLTGLYGMYNYLLPIGTGEVTLVALLKYRLQVSVEDGLVSLIASRFFDFSAIAMIIPVMLIFYWHTLPVWAIYSSLIFCVVVLIVNLFLFYFLNTKSTFSWIKFPQQNPLAGTVVEFLSRFRGGLVMILKKNEYLRLLIITLAIWLCVYTNYYLVVVSLGYQVTYFQVIVVSIIMIPMALLPIQGLANFGTHEIGWVIAFSIFNQNRDMALNVAFSTHILLLFFVLLLGFFCYLIESAGHARNRAQSGI